ncbi:acyl-CoA acyltransferase [Tepidamorphus sp. 3E244]|uniref:acyl-CoA acyltransferase n=1 Tax=Tepidamorphus sp. 3E244 TaxID=3385498 RepID=UPI0038FCAC7B
MTENRVRCRPIGDADLDAVAGLLASGFAHRPKTYFLDGLNRVREREAPDDLPRYGYLLEQDGKVVGAVLLIFSQRSGIDAPRCNIASWYVEPAHRMHAAMLSAMALKHRHVTYLNVTPAPNTWPILEAQGYKRYCSGLFASFPALCAPRGDVRLEAVNANSPLSGDLPPEEARMLREACATGCTSFIAHTPDGAKPFVFLPFRMRSGRVPLPAMQLAYARSPEDFVACAAPLGRALAARGRFAVLMDANGPVAGLPGLYTEKRGRKYVKGPGEARLCDLVDTELVVFGL